MKYPEVLFLKVDPEMKAALKEWAEEDRVSMSQKVRVILQAAIDARG